MKAVKYNFVTTWQLESYEESTAMTLYWNVYTTKAWMNVLAPFLRPIFVFSHNKVMRDGLHGLQAHLRQQGRLKLVRDFDAA